MHLGLRTTVFWNIFVLMAVAVLLISVVVVRITEQQLFRQRTLAGHMVFSTIAVSLSRMLSRSPGVTTAPDAQSLVRHFTNQGICREIVLVDNDYTVLADSKDRMIGRQLVDSDIASALPSGAPRTRIYQEASGSTPCLAITGPLYLGETGKRAGVLKAVFSLQDIQQRIRESSRIILLYILVDGCILMAFGMFLLHRSLLRPINRLIRLTENISEGTLDSAPFPLAGRNEIGQLATALRTMAHKLTEERATIEQQVRTLEEKNRQLLQAQREVIQTEKLASIGRLAAGIAHEIGNPLGIILGYMHMLRSGTLDEGKRADYLGRIEAETERINSIIRDLLDYAQPSSRELQAVNINASIEGIYALIAYQKEFNSITPIFHLAEGLPPILANEQLIKQLVLNLTLNARDAMPEGGILTFTTSLDAAGPQPRVCCEVADTGTGIPPEHQGRIFDPFFTTKEQGKGTGLGLSNVHRIVELFGGGISFTSNPGQGTTFMIRFPVMESFKEQST